MDFEAVIGEAVRREAEASAGKDPGPLTPATILSETGLDSIGFATLIVEMEERLGVDPFSGSEEIVYPDTFGELVSLYTTKSKNQ